MPKDDGSPTALEEKLIDAHVAIKGEWLQPNIDFNHSTLCSLGLPYRSQGEATSFVRSSGNTTLRLEAGKFVMANGEVVSAGLPYGAQARIIIIFLMSEAVKRQSPVVELGMSFTRFCREMGFHTDGRTMKRLREQVRRMSVLSMSIQTEHEDYTDFNQSFVFRSFKVNASNSVEQLDLFPSEIEFSHEFYSSLKNHAVPLRHEALKALKNSARALDIYCWLAYRLPLVKKRQSIRWTSIRWQFANNKQHMGSFKRDFITALKHVLVVYPEAQLTFTPKGITLYQSAPPVRRLSG